MKIGKDKFMHAGVCFVFGMALAATGYFGPAWRVAIVAVGIGGAKELYDMTHEGHDAEWADLAADFVGAILGEVLMCMIS